VRSGVGVVVGLISIAGGLAACGGSAGRTDGGSGSCHQVPPCGGSLLGTWTITSWCGRVTPFIDCPGGMFDESGLTKSGTITFNADLTFTAETTTSGTMRMTEPLACLPSASNCDDVAASISTIAPATNSCTTAGSVCDCTSTYVMPFTLSRRGTYVADGGVAIYEGTFLQDYCVEGDRLHLHGDPTIGSQGDLTYQAASSPDAAIPSL